MSRRSPNLGSAFGKENMAPASAAAALLTMPPPALSEETLMAPEHNEILAKLKYISILVDKIIEVARHKAAPLSAIGETVSALRSKSNPSLSEASAESNSPYQRRLQQLLLYMRCLHILSQTLDLSRAELKAKKLKPSTSVKNSNALFKLVFQVLWFLFSYSFGYVEWEISSLFVDDQDVEFGEFVGWERIGAPFYALHGR